MICVAMLLYNYFMSSVTTSLPQPDTQVVRHVLRLWKQTLNNLAYSDYDAVLQIQAPVFVAFDEETRLKGGAGAQTRAAVLEALQLLFPRLERHVEDFARNFLIANSLLASFRSYEHHRTPSVRNVDLLNPSPSASHAPWRDGREADAADGEPTESTIGRQRSVPVPEHAQYGVDSSLLQANRHERLRPGHHGEFGEVVGRSCCLDDGC